MTRDHFKSLFDKHFNEVRNYVYYRSGNTELATDIAQETFMKIWEKQLNMENDHARRLLFKIAGDIFVSSYRKQKVMMNFQFKKTETETSPSPDEQLHFAELSNQYEMALLGMPENQRTVFLMSRMDKMKYAEIAETLGLSIKAIEKRMSLALSTLKIKLNQ